MGVRLCILLLLLSAPYAGAAQDHAAPLDQASAALREQRYDDAIDLLKQVVRRQQHHADAHYLLAQAYLNTDPPHITEARRAVQTAIDREPDRLNYRALKLRIERADRSKLFPARARARRIEAAQAVLRLDSTHALAHAELGYWSMNMYLALRNNVTIPHRLKVQSSAGEVMKQRARVATPSTRENEEPLEDPYETFTETLFARGRFDLDKLEWAFGTLKGKQNVAADAYEQAVQHFEQARASDPMMREVYGHLMRLYAAQGDYERALALSEAMHAALPHEAVAWLYAGLALHRLGRIEEAAERFATGLQRLPPDDQMAFLDLEPVLSPDEVTIYRQDEDAYAATFWARRDPRLMTPQNERRLEHFARLVYADLLYADSVSGTPGWETEPGGLFVRYGLPEREAVIAGPLYDGDPPSTKYAVWDYDDFQFVFWNAFGMGEYQLYSPAAINYTERPEAAIDDYVTQARRITRETPERFVYDPPGVRVDVPAQVSVFKGIDVHADVIVAQGVQVPYKPKRGVLGLGLRTGAFLLDESSGVTDESRRTVDALSTTQIHTFGDVALWTDVHTLTATPGTYEVAAEFETHTGKLFGVHRTPASVPDFATPDLRLSDVLLAYLVEESDGTVTPGSIHRNGLTIQPAPWGVFQITQPVYFYVEVYNLTPEPSGETRYEVEAILVEQRDEKTLERLIRQAFGGQQPGGVSARFTQTGHSPDEGHYLVLDVRDQTPGTYTLAVRVKDVVANRTTEARRTVSLE